jgi:squalene-associated FAD-dependent desaturase
VRFTGATIAGAGLAGLSAAVTLRRAGLSVAIREASANVGGRCRSYVDPQFGRVIDNGNHLVLSGNGAVARFRAAVGASPETLAGPEHADFAFHDVGSGAGWTVRINDGPLPWWVGVPRRRVPGTQIADYVRLLRLLDAREGTVGARAVTRGPLWERLLEPVLLAVLNTPPAQGSARLTAAVLRKTLGKGGTASRPLIAEPSLGAAFIDPALAWLDGQGASLATGRRLRAIAFKDDRATALDWGTGPEPIADGEAVVLAVPPWEAARLVPGLTVPDAFHAIVNVHFDISPPAGAPTMLGLIGGTAEWVFAFPDRIAITISAADTLLDIDREELARRCWADVCGAYSLADPLPRWQVVKEKRATFAATPAQNAKRSPARTRWRNLFLAGDWTQTGLPATIEGALLSGETAAGLVLGRGSR